MDWASQEIRQASFRGIIGVARQDITPPVGIYARCWGAATHDVAEGIHRPLTLTAITFQRDDSDTPLVLIAADLMSWRSRDAESAVIAAFLKETRLPRERLMFCLSHTHAAPSVRREDSDKPGGHLIKPYQEHLLRAAIVATREAQASKKPATLSWRYGRCDLASNRDLADPAGGERVICGFNPSAPADDTLLVGRVSDDATGRSLANIVNYACHPTTLAWDNRLISPDYVGAIREVIEAATNAPCLFLQGASGELAPAEQYSGETALADRHGRQLGYAVLSTLQAIGPPRTMLAYHGVVESGAPLAVWKRNEAPADTTLAAVMREVDLPLKSMPPLVKIEEQWRTCDDPVLKERLGRQLAVRRIVGEGATARVPFWVWRLGDALLLGHPNEAYSLLQTELRRRLRPRPLGVMNLVNGSAAYLPPHDMYEKNTYAVWQTPFAAGSLEALIDAAASSLEALK